MRHERLTLLTVALLFVMMSGSLFAQDGGASPSDEDPAVRELPDGSLRASGRAKIPSGLRADRAARFAAMRAELDAKRRIARHLHPEYFKGGYGAVRIEASGIAVVSTTREETPVPQVRVELSVPRENMTVTPIPRADCLAGATEVRVHPDALEYLSRSPGLADGNGQIFAYKGGWLALGGGLAALPEDGEPDAQERRELEKIARAYAMQALTEAVFGTQIRVMEAEGEVITQDKNARAVIREWLEKETRETVEGKIRGAVELGSCVTEDRHLLILMGVANVAVTPWAEAESQYYIAASDDLPGAATPARLAVPLPPEWKVDPEWDAVLRARPDVWDGGLLVVDDADATHVIGVGAAKLSGQPAQDRLIAPTVAEADAKRGIGAYLKGADIKAVIVAREEYAATQTGDALAREESESLHKELRERVGGELPGMQSVGSWKSGKGDYLFSAFHAAVDK